MRFWFSPQVSWSLYWFSDCNAFYFQVQTLGLDLSKKGKESCCLVRCSMRKAVWLDSERTVDAATPILQIGRRSWYFKLTFLGRNWLEPVPDLCNFQEEMERESIGLTSLHKFPQSSYHCPGTAVQTPQEGGWLKGLSPHEWVQPPWHRQDS